MKQVRYKQLDQVSFADMEVYSVLPEHPVWSRAADVLDFSFADDICAPLYTTRGPRPYAPSLKLKLHIVQRYYNLSDREMEERVIGDLFIKRFLGLPVSFIGFDHSTIGLDRERMGSALFDACHHHILAQAKQKGLWGDNKDVWLVDSFHTNGHVAGLSAYRLVQQAIVRVIQHLKRANRSLFEQLNRDLDLQPLQAKRQKATPEDAAVSFSQLVVLAYGLLHWFEKATVRPLFWSWKAHDRQLESLERQAILMRILLENTSGQPDEGGMYTKRPRQERPADRILSSVDPDVRAGKKRSVSFVGDKIQVVTSATHNVVLVAEPIPGNETDGERLQDLIGTVQERHQVKPAAVVADAAYGHGYNRRALAQKEVPFAAPLTSVNENFTGLFTNDRFAYDAQAGTMMCPAGELTSRRHYHKTLGGTQYHFSKTACAACPLREQCTTGVHGRKVFISDYYDEFQQAKAFNATEQAEQLMRQRSAVERKNHEAKNHHGLGDARTHTREKRRVDVKIVSMVMNMKIFIKQQSALVLGFVRKRPPCSRLLASPVR
ncbi:MAG: transposase [Paenibacillaceae bacterium]|nr:transposase [Paenibacillaceae bacterium]